MNKLSIGVLALVVGVTLGAALSTFAPKGAPLSGVTQEDETFKYDVDVEGTLTAADVTATDDLTVTDDATVNGGQFVVTTSNTATSEVQVGCIQMTATSTASPVKLVLGIPSSTATTSQYGATTLGAVYYAYGTCP